jgi:endonuclease YncB( thermonuclease family)
MPAFARTDINGSGTAHGVSVSDGDTVKFGMQPVRLFGIDAPEKLQPCDEDETPRGDVLRPVLARTAKPALMPLSRASGNLAGRMHHGV